jgi:hypothetical protein
MIFSDVSSIDRTRIESRHAVASRKATALAGLTPAVAVATIAQIGRERVWLA